MVCLLKTKSVRLPPLCADHKTAGGLGSVFCKLSGFYKHVLLIKRNHAARPVSL